MSFLSKDLSVLAYANGFTLWHYKTEDKYVDVLSDDYFNDASTVMVVGDIIVVNVDTGGTPASGLFLVSGNTGGVVDLNDMTVIGGADSD